MNVMGKKLNDSGSAFLIFIRFFPRLFFLDSTDIPGKWLIFWCGCILARVYGFTALSVQQISKFKSSMAE